MQISVIIPVYNAENFVQNSAESAICHKHVSEILLIDDGSTDNSLGICKEIATKYKKVKLLTHPNNVNKGAGASRNLGIKHSTNEIISFLDADDIYLDNRFDAESELLKMKNIDGVYGATGIKYENAVAKEIWQKKYGQSRDLSTLTKIIQPEELFKNLILATHGTFTTDAITLKKRIFLKTGLFNEKLKLHQDTDMWLKISSVGSLVPGIIEKAIATRRVHANNRITQMPKDFSSRNLMFQSLLEWAVSSGIEQQKIDLIRYKIWKNKLFNHLEYRHLKQKYILNGKNFSASNKLLFFLKQIAKNPNLLFSKYPFYLTKELVKSKK